MLNDESDECIHLIFPASACTICSAPAKEKAQIEADGGKIMTAIYDGQCPDCSLPIYANRSRIKRRKNGIWYHKRCAEFLDRNRI